MLRVLHCIYDDPANPWVGGGGAMRVWEIYRRLAGRVRATVATGNFPGASNGVKEGVEYRRLGWRAPYPMSRLTYSLAATRLLRRGDFDVALVDFSVYTPISLPRRGRVGLVVHMLHGPTAAARWGRAAGGALVRREARALRQARWISTTSDWMVGRLEDLTRGEARVIRVGSGVPDEFAGVPRRERGYFLYYGRLDVYQKGIDTLIEAFAAVRRDRPDLDLHIAGRGKDAREVRELAASAGVAEAVHLHEGADRLEVLELLSGALALLMPSRLEGLPMVPAEAMAAGVPVIAADVGAVAEVVERGAGVLIRPGDPAALAASALRLAADADLRRRMSEAARISARRFSWERIADEHLEFLRIVAAGERYSPTGSDTE